MNNLKEIPKSSVLANPIRLGIMLYLLPRGKALFIELQNILEVTPGNLDSHLRRLQREGYVEIKKILADRPRTLVKITERGAEETKEYVKMLRNFLDFYE